MIVQATLTYTIGHVLTGTVTLQEKPTDPVEIVTRTNAAATSDNDSAAGEAEYSAHQIGQISGQPRSLAHQRTANGRRRIDCPHAQISHGPQEWVVV